MKKIFLSLVIMIMATCAVRSQTLTDSATLRAYINANIVTNGSKQITAAQLNRILVGYLNMWPRYSIDSLRESNDSIYARKNKVWQFVFKASAGGGPGGAGNTFQYNNEGAFAAAADFFRTETDGRTRYGIGYQNIDYIPAAKVNITGDTVVGESELVTNGNFTGNADDWTLDGGATYGSNMVSGAEAQLYQPGSLSEGSIYMLTFDIVGGDEVGTVQATIGSMTQDTFSQIGSHTLIGPWNVSLGGFTVAFFTDAAFTGAIDNVSLHLLTIGSAAIFDGIVGFNAAAFFNKNVQFSYPVNFQESITFNGSEHRFTSMSGNGGVGWVGVDDDGDISWSAGPTTVYTGDGTFTGSRHIGLNGFDFNLTQSGFDMLTVSALTDEVLLQTTGGASYHQAANDIYQTAPDEFLVSAKRTTWGATQSTYFGVNDALGHTYLDIDTTTAARHVKIGARGSGTNNVWLDFDDAAGGAYFHGGLFNIGDANLFAGNLMGYTSGTNMGGNVTQATSKSTAVTNNKYSGTITMNNASLAANTSVSFTFNNATLSGNARMVVLNILSGGTAGAYHVSVGSRNTAGSCTITLTNVSGGSLGEAVVIQFMVLAAVL